MSEFTKGEWQIMPYTRRDGDNIRWVKAVRGKKHIPICRTFSPCAEANARLIAAAPVQNQVLMDVYADAELLPDGRFAITEKRLNDIFSAIAKAEKGAKQ